MSAPPKVSEYYRKRLNAILAADTVDLSLLKECCWSGCISEHRAQCWKLLLGYLPCNQSRREATIKRKRKEYLENFIPQHYAIPDEHRSSDDQSILRQILLDIPRTAHCFPFMAKEAFEESMERVLYVWAVRHPASGYVQGINDLVPPFYALFLADRLDKPYNEIEDVEIDILREIEADVYWCLTRLLDGIQDHYTGGQPGLQRMLARVRDLLTRIDGDLTKHMESCHVNLPDFTVPWLNCLFCRELSLEMLWRLWDSYLCEPSGFSSFHSYVCAATILKKAKDLKKLKGPEELMPFLQRGFFEDWSVDVLEEVLAEAFILKSLFHQAPGHLR